MAMSQSVTSVQVENHVFPAAVTPPDSSNTLFLGGAGVRGMEIQGKFIAFTVIAVYLESIAIPSLAVKWKGKTPHELTDSVDFFKDIFGGPFEKFTQVTMVLPLSGKQYSEKVAENCVTYLKDIGKYTEAESKAIDEFLGVFKNQNFTPGASVLFTHSSMGSLHIGFSKDSSIPKEGNVIIENQHLSEAILESIIGKNGVSPQAKQSLAERLSELFGKYKDDDEVKQRG
ncbi:hypothetical protein Leryth_002794 [Lithospermum erythrorhizon]|nr:hypothetical protein Leryth_002794 [Lithospermum erythrorhizon]